MRLSRYWASFAQVFDFIGGRTRIRTLDPLIKSQLLYQLSYAPGDQGKPQRDQGALHSAQGSFVQPLN
jgi:hypothetical protein